MATPKQLVAKIAQTTGIPEGTVILHDRNLMTAGLRSLGVRGRGTSAVTYDDAVNLLIAVAVSRNVKDSAKVVVAYRDLPAENILEFADVKRGATLGDALSALMEVLAESPDVWKAGKDPDGFVDVFLYGPQPTARIEITRNSKLDVFRYEPEYPLWQRPAVTDLQFISKFTQSTLGHVGTLISDG